jgi:transcriptional regulator with XRE-family HTH domain
MQRTHSKMTPAQFQRWIERHGLTREATAEALGVSLRVVYAFISGERKIPRTVELLCQALDRDRARNDVTKSR